MLSLRLSRSSSSRAVVALFALALATAFAPGLIAGGVPKWLVIYAAAGCAILCSRRLALDWVSLAGIAFIGWAGLSLAWSSDPASGALQLHKIGVLAVLFCAARAWGRDWPLPELAVASIVAVLLLVPIVPIAGYGNENFITDYLLMLTPFLVVFAVRCWGSRGTLTSLARRVGARLAWLPLVAVAVYLVFFNDARTEYLVAGVALAVALLVLRQYGAALIVALSGLAFLLLWPQVFAKSLLARVELGSATIAMWWDQPLWGQGFGAFSYHYPSFGQAWRVFLPDYPTFVGGNLFAGAAHNETFQLMAELGLVGLVLAGLFLFLALRRAELSPALWCVGIAGLLSTINFPLQIPASGALAAVALGVACGPIKQPIRLPRAFAVPLLACVAGTAYLGSLEWRGHVAYGEAAMILRHDPVSAFQANLRAYEIYPWDWQIRHQLYRTFAIMAERNTVRVGRNAMERIYTISSSAAPFKPYVIKEKTP